jgi:hypothetical protein
MEFTNRPNVPKPERDRTSNIHPDDVPPPISEETILGEMPIDERDGIADNILARIRASFSKTEKLQAKLNDTLAYHLASLQAPIPPMPDHIKKAITALLGESALQQPALTEEQKQCIATVATHIPESDTKAAETLLGNDNSFNDDISSVVNMIIKQKSRKYVWGIEFLLQVVRFCMAYAVHMIVGGLCSMLRGQLNIPIPFVGSFPAGTMLALQVVAPVERSAKAALGFPCSSNMPPPEFCFDIGIKEKDVFNLLPCCIPAGVSGSMLKLQETIEKSKGSDPLSNNIKEYLKSIKTEGGFAAGYIKTGSALAIVDNDINNLLSAELPDAGNKSAMEIMAEHIRKTGSIDEISPSLFNTVSTADIRKQYTEKVNSWFQCIAQMLQGQLNAAQNDDGEYKGPPCIDPNSPGHVSDTLIYQAREVMNYLAASETAKNDPGPVDSGNLTILIAMIVNNKINTAKLEEMNSLMAEYADVLSPDTRDCIKSAMDARRRASLTDLISDPSEFFSRLNTDNKMSVSFVPEDTLAIGNFDIGYAIGDNLPVIGDIFNNVMAGLEAVIDAMDQTVSAINGLTRALTTKEMCCIIYMLVLLSSLIKERTICPTDDIRSFFKYKNTIAERADIAELKLILSFLKMIIDAIRQQLAMGIQVNGLKIPSKAIYDRIKNTLSTVTNILLEAMTEPINKPLAELLGNPELKGMLKNNCFYAFDLFSILKCGLEWAKVQIAKMALELLGDEWNDITIMKNVRIGGGRIKALDLLSKLIRNIIAMLEAIGDCYDPADYTSKIIEGTISDQYSMANELFTILQKANVSPIRLDEMTMTIDGGNNALKMTLTTTDPDVTLIAPDGSRMADPFANFHGDILTPRMIGLLSNSAPLSVISDDTPARRLLPPDEFVKALEEYTGTSLSEVYAQIMTMDDSIYQKFIQEA